MIKKFVVGSILIVLSILGIISTTEAKTETEANRLKGRIGVGLGYSWISIKYGIGHKFSTEVRGAFDTDIIAVGGRLYYNLNPKDRAIIFCGAEGDYITFKKTDISGKGYAVYTFVGGEYFITNRFTLILDIGSVFISLKEDKHGLTAEGIEYIFNLGVNFYLI